MEEKLMDKVISDALKEDIVLPDIINLKVDEALDNIINRNKEDGKKRRVNNRFLKAAIITLAIVGVGAMGIRGENIVSYAKIFVDSVFRTMKDDKIINEDFYKYASKVTAEATDNDVTISVTEVLTDGITVKIGYTITDNKHKGRLKDGNGLLDKKDIYINGEKPLAYGSNSYNNRLDDNAFIEMESYNLKKRLPSKFNIKLIVNSIYGIEGNWELDFNVNSEVLSKHSKIIEVNKDYKIGECTYYLKDIVYAPTGNYIDIKAIAPPKFKHSDGEKHEEKGIIVTDENGVIIQINNGYELWNRGEYLELFYEISGIIDHMPKEYNIIPVTKKIVDNVYEEGKKLDITNMEKITVKVQE